MKDSKIIWAIKFIEPNKMHMSGHLKFFFGKQ
jgi:hypothetical protein